MSSKNMSSKDEMDHDFKKTIDRKNRRYLEFYKQRNFDGIAAMYSQNCRFMPAGFPIQKGPDGIAAFWKMAADLGYYSLWFETMEVDGPYGDYAVERCRYVFHDEQGEELQVGKYIVIWMKESDGDWRYLWDIWNPDCLPPGAIAS